MAINQTTLRKPPLTVEDLRLDLLAAFVDLRGRVAALEAEAAERRRRRLLPGDPAFLARLLPALSGCWGDESFLVRHLLEEDRLASVSDGHSAKSIGKLFARAAGVPIGAYVLVDLGWNDHEKVRRYRVDGVSRGF